MSEPLDMDAPVTRREMHQALETWAAVIIDKLTTSITTGLSVMEGRFDAKLVALEGRFDAKLISMERRLVVELGRGTRASEEELTTRINVVDEQYRDLPARVAKLEAKNLNAPVKRRAASSATARRRKRS